MLNVYLFTGYNIKFFFISLKLFFMKNLHFSSFLSGVFCLLLASCGYIDPEDIFNNPQGSGESPEKIVIHEEDLFPEGIEYDKLQQRFLVSSVRYGAIGAVNDNGDYTVLFDDEELISTIGIHIDQKRQRLLVAISDPGASVRTSPETQEQLAAVAAYSLLTGERIFYTRLDGLAPEGTANFANDIAVDKDGYAYVTDSFAGVIYKVDRSGEASVFYQNEDFIPAPGDFGLNGIELDHRGFLLVAKSNTGEILRFPLDNPGAYTTVELPVELPGPDGIYLKNPNELLAVNNAGGVDNGVVYTFKTNNRWESATVKDSFTTPAVFPTTVTVRNGHPYVLYAYLNVLFSGESRSEFEIVKAE